ncbi:MAG: hypothetical protein NPIRA06_31910 [Nitrospirales bacterium]|nr:MAG: hypothetical protein NPIRA06_31910 [Nitrospirales bacterium]
MMRKTQQTASREEAKNALSASGLKKTVVSKRGATSSRSVDSDNILIGDSSFQKASFLAEDLEARIALRAHELYEQRGGCHGEDQADWFEAERQILSPT